MPGRINKIKLKQTGYSLIKKKGEVYLSIKKSYFAADIIITCVKAKFPLIHEEKMEHVFLYHHRGRLRGRYLLDSAKGQSVAKPCINSPSIAIVGEERHRR